MGTASHSLELIELRGLRVLVVEDNKTNQTIFSRILDHWSMKATLASSGFEALEILRSGQSFPLILLDYHMPGMDGIELAHHIKSDPRFSAATILKRLKQLQIQREGAAALSRPEVVAKLALTSGQQDSIKKIVDGARTATRAAFNRDASPEERQAAMTKMQESRAKTLKEALAVLNDDQLMDWTELTGKEFKFPQGGMGFGNFGGRRANPPANQ